MRQIIWELWRGNGTGGDVHYKRMDRESQLKQILGKLEYLFENEITYHYDEKYGKVPLACEPFSRARDYVLLHPPDVPLPVSVKREGDELIWNYEIYAIEQEALARFTNQGK